MLPISTEIPGGSNTKTEVKETSRNRLNLFETPAAINIPIYSESIIKTKTIICQMIIYDNHRLPEYKEHGISSH